MAHPCAQPGSTRPGNPADAAAEPDLRHELAELHAHRGNPESLLAAFRNAVVYVPTDGADRLLTAEKEGLHWIFAFTAEAELEAFARSRSAADRPSQYCTTRGYRLLDTAVRAVGSPAGVALDVAGSRPMLFPPVSGIVPADCAVD